MSAWHAPQPRLPRLTPQRGRGPGRAGASASSGDRPTATSRPPHALSHSAVVFDQGCASRHGLAFLVTLSLLVSRLSLSLSLSPSPPASLSALPFLQLSFFLSAERRRRVISHVISHVLRIRASCVVPVAGRRRNRGRGRRGGRRTRRTRRTREGRRGRLAVGTWRSEAAGGARRRPGRTRQGARLPCTTPTVDGR